MPTEKPLSERLIAASNGLASTNRFTPERSIGWSGLAVAFTFGCIVGMLVTFWVALS